VSEELDFLKTIATRLDAGGFPYMLSGSLALTFYAKPRMTRDIDIVIAIEPVAARRFTDLFASDCYVDEDMVREAAGSRDMFNIIHNESVIKADFVVRKDDAYRLAEFDRRGHFDIEGTKIVVVAPEDLVLSKLLWSKDSASQMQRDDVRNLLDSNPEMDWDYLERWAGKLGVDQALDQVRR